MKKRICIVDGDSTVLDAIQGLIATNGFAVETFVSTEEFLQHLDCKNTACVIVDVQTPEIGGLELQQILTIRARELPIILVTSSPTVAASVQAMKAGAIDFLTKPIDPHRLHRAITEALWCREEQLQQAHEIESWRTRFRRLTFREQQVFKLVTEGLPNKQIAAELGASEKTIKVHRGRIMRKLGIQSLPDLVRFAERLNRLETYKTEPDFEPAPTLI